VIAVGQPPCEKREVTRCVLHLHLFLKGTDFLQVYLRTYRLLREGCYFPNGGCKHCTITFGMYLIRSQTKLAVRVREDLADLHFFFLSDVWLDHPDTLPGIQRMFDNCIENSFIPKLIVLCGNFTSTSISHGNGRDVQRYQGIWFHSQPSL